MGSSGSERMSLESMSGLVDEIYDLSDKKTEVMAKRRKKIELLSNELKMYINQEYTVEYEEYAKEITIYPRDLFTPTVFCLLNKLNIDYIVDWGYHPNQVKRDCNGNYAGGVTVPKIIIKFKE